MRRYPPSTIHSYLDLTSTHIIQSNNSQRHNITPPFQTLVQAPYPLPTYATHTTATQTQTHFQHVPCSYRISTSPIQLSHALSPSPPRPPEQNKHTSHTLHQLRPNKSPFPKSYLHKVDAKSYPSPLFPYVTLTYTTHIIPSTAPTYVPHCHPWICGQTPPK